MYFGQCSDRPEEALGPMLSQLTRTMSLRLQPSPDLDPVHVTFAWELMEPLAQLCEYGSFREVFRLRNVHHLSILLCRKLLEEHVLKKYGISERQWPLVDIWIRLGILSASPSLPEEEQMSSSNIKLFKKSGFKRIWQCHYVSADRDYLITSDFDWMVYVVKEARTSGPIYSEGATKVYLPRTITYCLTILCEAPDVANDARCNALYPDLSWALKKGGVFGQAALKLARAMCGQARDVNQGSLRALVNGTRPFLNLPDTLSILIDSYYQTSDEFYTLPQSYLLHMAYLDILSGFIALGDEDLPSILASNIDNCVSLAWLLRSNSYNWYDSELHMMRACLGRQTDDRSWKVQSSSMPIDPNDVFPNSFIRDIWHRLGQLISSSLDDHAFRDRSVVS